MKTTPLKAAVNSWLKLAAKEREPAVLCPWLYGIVNFLFLRHIL
ncbi:hypothetical protein PPEP_a0694 [Pseudoalteromonas peptidolytica F12-50-A1]|uniref:Uncharacterized protein n=1 Tax=Pseudoalteromonas peptidolytica F12-50-A1 TaxID=1315280 RepID=A0A8I0MUR9_9GAMM|nr:hypothetical protein [Pseudoalteromonas peptidolytica F12-50-A1]